MGPVLETLIEAATAAGAIRADVSATDVLHAVALLCQPIPGEGPGYGLRLVDVFIDGLRPWRPPLDARPATSLGRRGRWRYEPTPAFLLTPFV